MSAPFGRCKEIAGKELYSREQQTFLDKSDDARLPSA